MIYLPCDIPASYELQTEMYELGKWKSVSGCLRVLLLNLMPEKQVTELDISRVLQQTDVSLQIIPIKIKGQSYKNVSEEYMNRFYLDFDEISEYSFDRLIVTGAPLEQIPFAQVRYWNELCGIMDWATLNVERSLYICWAAQAGLYHHYNIQKRLLEKKIFGVYAQYVVEPDSPLMRNMCPAFPMPNSRYIEVSREDVVLRGELSVLAESEVSGVGIVSTKDFKNVFILGHLEYPANTLHNEFNRDRNKGIPIQIPEFYYDSDQRIIYSWGDAAVAFYKNWLIA